MVNNINKVKKAFLGKVDVMSLLFFVLALFLLDVNLNLISVYGSGMRSPVFNGETISATSLFWLGFIIMSVCFFIICLRSLERRGSFKFADIFFVVVGILAWGIILSGGLLLFFGGDNFVIPLFSFMINRIDYYHFGIGLSILTIIYFAMRK
jgi:hypothetical protein